MCVRPASASQNPSEGGSRFGVSGLPHGDANDDRRAAAGRRVYLQRPTNQQGTLTHSDETQPFALPECPLSIEPAAIVFNDERGVIIPGLQKHRDVPRSGVFGNIRTL